MKTIDDLMAFVDANPDMDLDELLEQIEKDFPKEVMQQYTAAFTGVTPKGVEKPSDR
jgi:hypothetical protein